MAEKRMFAKTIIDSDAFLDMPLSCQALYFHLSMRADDEGFLNNAKMIMRTVGANQNDYDLLVAKRFVIQFDDGICVIKHWRIHNYIRGDRKKETVYKRERAMLSLKPNGAYTLSDNDTVTDICQSSDSQVPTQMDTQYRLDEISIDKSSIEKKQKSLAEAQTYFPNDEKLNQTFIDFIKMRKTLKNGAMTDRAITMMINKLSKYDNDTAIEMLNRSILNNWKDVYELNSSSKGNKSNKQSMSDFQSEAKEWLNEREGVSSDFFGD